MYNTLVAQIAQCKSHLRADIFPVQIRIGFYMILKRPTLAKLSNNVAVVWSVENFLKIKDILMVYIFEYFDFVLEEFFFSFV